MESPDFQIRFMESGEEAQVCKLVERVFLQSDAQDLSQQGISEFLSYANPVRMAERVTQDLSFVLVAVVADEVVGMVEIRNFNHVALLFVSDDHQRQGLASHLVEKAISICREKNPVLRRITVNAAPSALPVYARWGFHPIGDEVEVDGIRFTHMALDFS